MSMSKYASKEHYEADEPNRIADWLESPQCGLMGDERVQRAAVLLRRLAVPEAFIPMDAALVDRLLLHVHRGIVGGENRVTTRVDPSVPAGTVIIRNEAGRELGRIINVGEETPSPQLIPTEKKNG